MIGYWTNFFEVETNNGKHLVFWMAVTLIWRDYIEGMVQSKIKSEKILKSDTSFKVTTFKAINKRTIEIYLEFELNIVTIGETIIKCSNISLQKN